MSFSVFDLPMGVMTDSYKASHFKMYPEAKKMVAYGEFRSPAQFNKSDQRFLFFGIRYLVDTWVARKWTMEDVEKAELFYKTHNAGFTDFAFPKDLFTKFVKENDGHFPIKIEALREGTVVHTHTPVYQMITKEPYSRLCTFLETLLTMLWYPTTVATLSRMIKDHVEEAFEKSVDEEAYFLLNSRLHDFGFRGCTGVEQAMIGGAAHLINFDGSDTMTACYYVQFGLNNGKPVGTSIPATEHSVMTAWKTEREAILNTMEEFGTGTYATVMDSYDYTRALEKIVPSVKEVKLKKGGFWVFRPDSGDPVEAILMALKAGEKVFGATKNKKGYKVINGAGCIQGDGINIDNVKQILDAVLKAGYSAQSVAFGMGGGLLQKLNRDTMSFATKLSYIHCATGEKRDVMKLPKSDSAKISLPGCLRVKRDQKTGLEYVYPKDADDDSYDEDDLLRPVYDHRPLENVWDDFETIRQRVATEWKKAPRQHNPISKELESKIESWTAAQRQLLAQDEV